VWKAVMGGGGSVPSSTRGAGAVGAVGMDKPDLLSLGCAR